MFKLHLKTLVNGQEIPASKLLDPFDLRLFPLIIDQYSSKVLERLGRDISVVTHMYARADPTIIDVDVSYEVREGDLYITVNQHSEISPAAMRAYFMETEQVYPSDMHVLKATLAVLHGKEKGMNLNDIGIFFIKEWQKKRSMGAVSSMRPIIFFPETFVAIGSAFLSGIPI
ncbi:MAG: hypothetical protein AB7D08_03590 [Bacteroidales bacterium]|jgi:hypothetical protein